MWTDASDAGEDHTTVDVQGYEADLFQSEGTIAADLAERGGVPLPAAGHGL